MADVQHATRDHATWSASSTERLWNCPGALALTDGLPETTSEAADWGTACHQIAERCLRGNGPAERYIGKTEKGKTHSFEVDEEMAETAQMYVDYVRSLVELEDDAKLWIEQHFTLADLKPPFDAGGTADAVVYLPNAKTLEVVDLKGGRGHVVEAKGNPQGRTYALGAMLAHQGLAVEQVKVTIVQPRAPHKDGRIRSDIFHVADLVEWTTDLVMAMKRARYAMDAYTDVRHPAGGQSLAAWGAQFLAAGDHCKFCKAKATCPAIEQKVIDTVGVWFEDTGAPRLANTPPTTDPVERGHKLDMLDMIEGWIAAFREAEHRLAEAGDPAANYGLVAKQGREKFTDDKAVVALLDDYGVKDSLFLNAPKLRTPKQVRAALAKADLSKSAVAELTKGLAPLSETPDAGTNLVRLDKTTRPPVQGTAERFFEPST